MFCPKTENNSSATVDAKVTDSEGDRSLSFYAFGSLPVGVGSEHYETDMIVRSRLVKQGEGPSAPGHRYPLDVCRGSEPLNRFNCAAKPSFSKGTVGGMLHRRSL